MELTRSEVYFDAVTYQPVVRVTIESPVGLLGSAWPEATASKIDQLCEDFRALIVSTINQSN